MAKPTAEQLAKINQKTLVPLTDDQVHTFSAKVIGTNLIPKYMMRITPNFLTKMSREAKEGVALLVDHPWQKWSDKTIIPYGRTYDSRLVQDGEELALYADHYMVKGQEVDGITTDQLANGIDSGTIFDTSAGFITSKHTCNICRQNYYNSSCTHFRGVEYDGKDCYIEADDGSLMENSLVFDGGYEGAGIKKNSLSRSQTKDVKQETQLIPLELDTKSLAGDGSVFYFFSKKSGLTAYVQDGKQNVLATNEGNEKIMADEQKVAEAALQKAQTDLNALNGLLTQIRTALGVTTDDGILTKITSLSAQAAVGESYKVKVTEEACGAGVRAMGEAFNVEAMKLSLSGLPVAEIEKIKLSYDAQAVKVLGGGGQHTQPADVNLPANALGAPPANPQNNAEKTPEEKQALARTEARAALENTGYSELMKKEVK